MSDAAGAGKPAPLTSCAVPVAAARASRLARPTRCMVKGGGPAKTVEGAGMAGRAAGRSGKAMAVYAGRKAAGKRAPVLVSLPVLAGASIASYIAVRKMRRGVKQTVPA